MKKLIALLLALVMVLALIKEVTASVCKFFFNSLVNLLVNNYRLFRSTYHTIVKCLRMNN